MAEVGGVHLPTAEADQAGPADAFALLQMITSYWVTRIVRAVAELSLADHVAAGALTAEEIARLDAGEQTTTYRLLRAAASLGLFAPDGERRFSVTPLGGLLQKGVPGSLREMARVHGMPAHWQSWGTLTDPVREGRTQMSVALGLPADQNVFDYFADHPEEGAVFAAAMSDATGMMIEDVVSAVDLGGVSVAVDVGGAYGAQGGGMVEGSPCFDGTRVGRPRGGERGGAQATR